MHSCRHGGPSSIQVDRFFRGQVTDSLLQEGPQIVILVYWDTAKMFIKPGVVCRRERLSNRKSLRLSSGTFANSHDVLSVFKAFKQAPGAARASRSTSGNCTSAITSLQMVWKILHEGYHETRTDNRFLSNIVCSTRIGSKMRFTFFKIPSSTSSVQIICFVSRDLMFKSTVENYRVSTSWTRY